MEHQKRDEEEEYEEQVAPDRIEPVMKETTHPPTHSHTHTPQDTTATAAEQKTIVVEEGEQGSLDLTRILTEAFYRYVLCVTAIACCLESWYTVTN